MAHQIRVDAECGVVRVEITGIVDSWQLAGLAAEARTESQANRLPLLYDVRRAEAGDLKQTDIFWIPRKLAQLKTPEARRTRVAMVVHRIEECPIATFWETVYRNVGLPARAFADEELALAWLIG